MQPKDIERFWSKVRKTDDCWYWNACTDNKGYGIFRLEGRPQKAHRVAYNLTHVEPLGRLNGCHSCDNPSCVRPDHIFAGTHADNMKDAAIKGRSGMARHPEASKIKNYSSHPGASNGRAKIDKADVRRIRQLARSGVPQREIASQYPINRSRINSIINHTTWEHVTDESA